MHPRLLLLLLASLACAPMAAAQETAESVIKAAIKAANLPTGNKVYHLTWTEKGKMTFNGQELPYDAKWAFEPTSKFRFDMKAEFGGQKMEIVFIQNGGKAKESAMGQTRMLEGEKLEETTHSAYQFWVNSLAPLIEEKGFTLKLLGDKSFNGNPVISIQVSRQGHRDVTLHFDKKTQLLAGCTDKVKDEFQGWKEVMQETMFTDYQKQASGELTFTSMVVKRDGQVLLQSKLSDAKRTDSLKPELFKLD